jgi:UDP-N-acetylglucosamine diphosphorylase/glucosamine-1-phosphate N-acetyltransferase|tara:strand:- start:2709 stop:3938 length:1230 start_codon:yes stop_codon:yes gene_type:complete
MSNNSINVYIYEDYLYKNLLPIINNRPTFEIRCGVYTCLDRLKLILPNANISLIVRNELAEITKEIYPNYLVNPDEMADGYWLLGNVLWSKGQIEKITKSDSIIFLSNNRMVAANLTKEDSKEWIRNGGPIYNQDFDLGVGQEINIDIIDYLWDAIRLSPKQIIKDSKFFNLGSIKDLKTIYKGIKTDNIFIDESVDIGYYTVVDASKGPVIIEKGSRVNPYCYLTGPLYIGPNCTIQSNTILRSGTVVGPNSVIGGEISQSIIQSNSNKAHFGYLGNSYLGSWINLGAGTTNSNLKNNYSNVSILINGKKVDSKQMKLGCFIGDYTRTAINTKINTGTIIGTGSNIVFDGTLPKSIDSFSWYVGHNKMKYDLKKFLQTLEIVKNRRGYSLSNAERNLLKYIYENDTVK